ncbi:PAS domain-containing protein [Mucilaginibacter sp. PAMB04274]|uniref:PAS domain-containing protein n=1 Tax=Mucilaginibacter sp. PAMB04274 TaxID=3138568 RepID=UPI00331A9F84
MANDVMIGFWGKDRSVIGKPLVQAVPELVGQPFISLLQNVWRTGITYEAKDTPAELLVYGKLQTFYFDFAYRAIRNEQGKVDCILHTAIDVTELNLGRAITARAREQQEAYERETELNGQLNESNQKLEVAQTGLNDLNCELERRIHERTAELAAANKELTAINEELLKVQQLLIERTNELASTAETLRIAAESASVGTWSMTPDGEWFTTPEVKRIYGLSPDESLTYRQALAQVRPDYVQYAMDAVDASLAKGEQFNVEYPIIEKAGGTERWIRSVGKLMQTQGHNNGYLYGALIDVTESKQDELALAKLNKAIEDEQEKLYQFIMQAPAGLALMRGTDYVFSIVNSEYQAILPGHHLSGRPFFEALPELKETAVEQALLEVYTTGETRRFYDQLVPLPDFEGEPLRARYFNFSYHAWRDELGHIDGIINFAYEVTDQVNARQKVEHAETQLRHAVAAAKLGSWHIHPVTRALQYNPELAQIFGYEGDGLMTYDQAIGQVTEEHRSRITQEIEQAINAGGDFDITYTQRRFNDGEIVWLRSLGRITQDQNGNATIFSGIVMNITEQMHSRLKIEQAEEMARLSIETADVGTYVLNTEILAFVTSPRLKELFGYHPDEELSYEAFVNQIAADYRGKVLEAVQETIETRKKYSIDYIINGLHDQKVRWVRSYGGLYPDAQGRYTQFYGVIMDITEDKTDEQRKNDFIGMVSHELKTPLTSMKGYLQMLQSKARKGEDTFTTGVLEKANKQVSKMTTMINGFLNVSRLESGKIQIDLQRFDMAELVQETEEESVATISSHQVMFAPVEETWVNADRDKIGQVMNNLISNAVKYSPGDSMISIACVTRDGKAIFSVKDEGRGISPEDLPNLFERYYRVQAVKDTNIAGFGIGLYLCCEIIKRHGGDIWAESELAKGSTFYFTLPVVE